MSSDDMAIPAPPSRRILTIPNLLSFFRLIMVPVFFVLMLNRYDYIALVILALSSATDFLDGYLARRLGQVTRLGQLLDPLADRLYIFAAIVALAIIGIAPWWIVTLVILRDVMLVSTLPILAHHGYGPLPVHHLGKVATLCLLITFPLLWLGALVPEFVTWTRPVGWGFGLWGVALYWWAGLIYVRQVITLVRTDRDESATV